MYIGIHLDFLDTPADAIKMYPKIGRVSNKRHDINIIKLAVMKVRSGEMTQHEASTAYGISRSRYPAK